MLKPALSRLLSFLLSNWGWLSFWLLLLVLELVHLRFLFGEQGLLLAGGDNYTHLFLGRWKLYPYDWDDYYPFGLRSFKITNLLGFQLYSQVLGFFSGAVIQRLIFFSLYLLKIVGFVKLARLFQPKGSPWALLPAVVLFLFNVFDSLGPLGFYQLLYGAYLPFFLYYFIKIFESEKLNLITICKLIMISVIASPVNSNTALSATIFIPPLLYFLLNVRRLNWVRTKNLLLLGILWLLANLWWMVPLWAYFQRTGSEILSRSTWFAPVATGELFQNFRFIGQWGWYVVHFLYSYYPYNLYFDKPLVVWLTYFLVWVAVFEATRRDEANLKSRQRLYLLGLFILGLLLVSGSRLPFGFFYQFLFDYLPGFKIFREPFTKFSEIYVLAFSLLLYLFLVRLQFQNKITKVLLWSLVVLSVAFAVKPGFTAEGLTTRWNGSVRTYRIELPDYWREFESFAREALQDKRVLTSPQLIYGSAWNWPRGFTSADDVAAALLIDRVSFVRAPLITGVVEESLVRVFFDEVDSPSVLIKFLSLLGVDYVLQENDVDWRYNPLALDPIKSEKSLGSFLDVQKTFGFFDEERVMSIANEEPNPFVREELKTKLIHRPALVLYRPTTGNRMENIFAAKAVVVAKDTSSQGLTRLLANPQTVAGDVYLSEEPRTKEIFAQAPKAPIVSTGQILGERYPQEKLPQLVLKKINPTKYEVKITSATSGFWLTFLERFDPGWKVYFLPGKIASSAWGSGFLNSRTTETWRRKPLPESQHFVGNSFANAWYLDPLEFGEAPEYYFIIEYESQRYFYLALLILAATVVFCLSSLVRGVWLRRL